MTSLVALALSGVLWTGSARVDVMMWESGGEHPYATDYELTYREATGTPVLNSRGVVVGHSIRLIPERIALKVRHEVRGLLNCTGTGQETLTEGPSAEIAVRPHHATPGAPARGGRSSASKYQLVLPRAIGAFACGTNKRNSSDRAIGIGSQLFHADVEVADPEARLLEENGTRMRGSYRWRQNRNYSDQAQHLIRYEFLVTWNLRREVAERPHNNEMQRTKPAQATELRR